MPPFYGDKPGVLAACTFLCEEKPVPMASVHTDFCEDQPALMQTVHYLVTIHLFYWQNVILLCEDKPHFFV